MDDEKALQFMQTAQEIGTKIVDAAGRPVLVARGKPEAWHGPYMATGKACLAAAFRKGTVSA